MIHEYLLLTVALLLAVLLLVMVGQQLKISYPIFLVIAGAIISVVPGIPNIRIDPDLVFLIFLPPILYEAAWYTSWRDFWKWKRPISLLAFGLVLLTSTIVAYFSSAVIPGFTLATGFLLGGIISPPDAVAATSVLKNVRIPKRLLTILEGESLVNDASSLIVFKFALAAIITGQFVLQQAVGDFFLLAGMGIVIGLLIGFMMYAIHRFLPTTPSIDTALTLLTPYLMYISAEYFHFSGVMAVVTGGLFLSYHSHVIFTYQSRLQATGVWSTLIFVMNGVVFILIGLELPVVMGGLESISTAEGIKYGILISILIIVIRLAWTYIIAFVPRALFRSIRESEPSPGWKGPLIISVSAMRGVVSLAAAFTIPLLLPGGEGFPNRNTILLITFVVIVITLVGQGLLLPHILKLIKMDEIDDIKPRGEQEAGIQLRLKKVSLNLLKEKYTQLTETNELVANLMSQLENDTMLTQQKLDSLECDEIDNQELNELHQVMVEILSKQREELARLRFDKTYSDEVLRSQASQLDLEEATLNETRH